MNPDAFVIDTAHGEPGIHPALRDSSRLVMLPDLGSATRESTGFRVNDNQRDFFEGRQPRERVH